MSEPDSTTGSAALVGNPPVPNTTPRGTRGPSPRAGGGRSELVRRVAFAVVAAPVTILLIRAGGVPLAVLLASASGVAAWELYRMSRVGGGAPIEWLGVPLAVLLPLLVAEEPRGVFEFPPTLIAASLVVVLGASIWVRGSAGRPLSTVGVTLFGAWYTGGMLSFAEAIRYHRFVADDAGGTVLLLLPVFLTWANDIGAYVIGRLVGGRKLAPSVSPGKTIAGAVGGLLATGVACAIYVRSVLQPVAQLTMSPRNLIVFAIVVCAAGQVGDLAESLLKREAGVKDSSGIFPGHGGVLDRIDSLLFALPVACILFAVPGLLLPVPGGAVR